MELIRKLFRPKTRNKDDIQSNEVKYSIWFVLRELWWILNPIWKSAHKKTHDWNSKILSDIIHSEDFPEELKETFNDTRNAIDEALKRNSHNIWSNLLDAIPLGIVSNPSSRLAIAGFIWLAISFWLSLREFIYRRNILNPQLRKFKETYEEYSWEEINWNIKLGYFDAIFDSAETIWELFLIIMPNYAFPSFLSPLLEIPLDSNSRKKYYQLMNELIEITLEVQAEKLEDNSKKPTLQ